MPTCPDAIADWLTERTEGLERVGMRAQAAGRLALERADGAAGADRLHDARHASGVLKMMPNKTDRHDARGLAQIVRTGWFKVAQIKSHDAYVNRAMLTARDALVGMRVRLENEIRGLLKTFGVMFGNGYVRMRVIPGPSNAGAGPSFALASTARFASCPRGIRRFRDFGWAGPPMAGGARLGSDAGPVGAGRASSDSRQFPFGNTCDSRKTCLVRPACVVRVMRMIT